MSSTEKRGGGLFSGGYGYSKAGNIGGNYIWWLETSELDDTIEVCHTTPKLDSPVNHKVINQTTPLRHESI